MEKKIAEKVLLLGHEILIKVDQLDLRPIRLRILEIRLSGFLLVLF